MNLGSKGPGPVKISRSYISQATKAAAHPVRTQILKALRQGERSTVDLEGLTGESRYNLYHHLNALEQVGLVGWKMRDNKTKLYFLRTPKKPEVAVLIFSEADIREKRRIFERMLDVLSEFEGEPIPYSDKISSVEICLNYSWDDKTAGEDEK